MAEEVALRGGGATGRERRPGGQRRPRPLDVMVGLAPAPSPPAIVRHLRADELALRTATGARFVALARDRQLVIRTLARDARTAAAVARLAPGERDDLDMRRDLDRLSAASPPQVGGVSVGPARHAGTLLAYYQRGAAAVRHPLGAARGDQLRRERLRPRTDDGVGEVRVLGSWTERNETPMSYPRARP